MRFAPGVFALLFFTSVRSVLAETGTRSTCNHGGLYISGIQDSGGKPNDDMSATPARKRLAEWLRLFNRGDFDGLLSFHEAGSMATVAQRRALQDYQLFLLTQGIIV